MIRWCYSSTTTVSFSYDPYPPTNGPYRTDMLLELVLTTSDYPYCQCKTFHRCELTSLLCKCYLYRTELIQTPRSLIRRDYRYDFTFQQYHWILEILKNSECFIFYPTIQYGNGRTRQIINWPDMVRRHYCKWTGFPSVNYSLDKLKLRLGVVVDTGFFEI